MERVNMNITAITVIDNNDFTTTLNSVIENDLTPKVYCIAMNKDLNISVEEALSKHCNTFEKSMGQNDVIYTANINNIQIVIIQSALKDAASLRALCIEYTINITDIYIVIDNGLKLITSAFSSIVNKFKDLNISFVYSDYIEKDIYQVQSSFHTMMKQLPNIKMYGIRSDFSYELTNNNYAIIASNIYNKSIVSKIPEALFIT
jgi:hypothetical protein